MTVAIDTSRRRFLAGSAAAAGGLALGFHIPFDAGREAVAQGTTPEINAWVVVKPDDSVVVRVARIDMGQGTVTGLVQLVAWRRPEDAAGDPAWIPTLPEQPER